MCSVAEITRSQWFSLLDISCIHSRRGCHGQRSTNRLTKSMTATFQTFTFLKSQKSRDEVRKLTIFFRLRDKDGGVRHKLKIQKFLLKIYNVEEKIKGKREEANAFQVLFRVFLVFLSKKNEASYLQVNGSSP